mmetsp:Transcript_59064/g.103370  ORF Transcript_59064/g.103370 Transcript_59064/m.103370 type:complete len:83 (+) Transcript_59064:556-804(+)
MTSLCSLADSAEAADSFDAAKDCFFFWSDLDIADSAESRASQAGSGKSWTAKADCCSPVCSADSGWQLLSGDFACTPRRLGT